MLEAKISKVKVKTGTKEDLSLLKNHAVTFHKPA